MWCDGIFICSVELSLAGQEALQVRGPSYWTPEAGPGAGWSSASIKQLGPLQSFLGIDPVLPRNQVSFRL